MLKKLFFLLVLSTLFSASQAQKKDVVITINTKYGNMMAVLFDETPKHKANFIKLVKEHYYDSLLFHRVIAGYVIQGGDPNSKKAKPGQLLGSGGPGYTIEAEINPNYFHKKGALAAARLGDIENPTKASSGSQFYIVQGTILMDEIANELKIDQPKLNIALQQFVNMPGNQAYRDTLSKLYAAGNREAFRKKVFSLAARCEKETGVKVIKEVSLEKIKTYTTVGGTPALDDGYTVFGEIIKGLDVIDRIAMEEKDGADRPKEDVLMFVTAKELSKKKITKLYGYHYPEIKK